jgi:hypothetical protein
MNFSEGVRLNFSFVFWRWREQVFEEDMERLPTEILAQIFKFYNDVAHAEILRLVCKSWKKLVDEGSFFEGPFFVEPIG